MDADKIQITANLEKFINEQGFTNGILFCTNNDDARVIVVNPQNDLTMKVHLALSEIVDLMHRKAKAHITDVQHRNRSFDTKEDF